MSDITINDDCACQLFRCRATFYFLIFYLIRFWFLFAPNVSRTDLFSYTFFRHVFSGSPSGYMRKARVALRSRGSDGEGWGGANGGVLKKKKKKN